MEISVDCAVFTRLAKLAKLNNEGFLRSIWLEITDGKMIAVATDRKIMAIEFLGEDLGPDFSMNAVVDDLLIAQCEIEKSFNSKITFTFNPQLSWTTAKTTLGYEHVGNAAIMETTSVGVTKAEENVLSRWRECLPDKLPAISTGGMFTRMERLAVLASTAPSGTIIFPEFIDVDVPVIVNDVHDPNWLGVFISKPEGNDTPDPVTIPGWVK